MRALAAYSIVVYHVWLYGAPDGGSVDLGPLTKGFDNLRAGVTLFFVLSGFLLFRPYVSSALRGRPAPSLGNYLRNRALRIIPAYWVILLLVAVLFHRSLLEAPKQLLANMFFLQDYVTAYMPHLNGGVGIVPAWSLAIEVVFYVTVPLLGGLAITLAARAALPPTAAVVAPIVVMVAVGIGAKLAQRALEFGWRWELSFLTHADWFAAGMAVAVLRVLWEDGRLPLPRGWRPAALVAAGVIALVAAKLYYAGTLSLVEYQSLIAVSCAILLALVVFAAEQSRTIRFLTWRPVFLAGLASYSLFLWHEPLVRAFRDAGLTLDGTGGFVVNLLLVSLVSGAAAGLTYAYVERPALARKRIWQSNEEAATVEAATVEAATVEAAPVETVRGAEPMPPAAPSAVGAGSR